MRRGVPAASRLRVPGFRARAESAPGHRRVQARRRPALTPVISVVLLVSLLTFLHYVGAQMRGPVLPLYAVAHCATATGVGVIVSAHMAVAAAGSIPLGRAADIWGRRSLLLVAIALPLRASHKINVLYVETAHYMFYHRWWHGALSGDGLA